MIFVQSRHFASIIAFIFFSVTKNDANPKSKRLLKLALGVVVVGPMTDLVFPCYLVVRRERYQERGESESFSFSACPEGKESSTQEFFVLV